MTESEKIELLMDLTEEENEKVVVFALRMAAEAIMKKAFPFRSTRPQTLPDAYEADQIEIAKYLIYKQGDEGALGKTENGIHISYESAGVPESMLRHILPRLKVPGGETA